MWEHSYRAVVYPTTELLPAMSALKSGGMVCCGTIWKHLALFQGMWQQGKKAPRQKEVLHSHQGSLFGCLVVSGLETAVLKMYTP